MNEADQAQQTEDAVNEHRIKAIRQAASQREMPPRGSCYFCLADFPRGDQRIYCDGYCAADHEQERRMKHGR